MKKIILYGVGNNLSSFIHDNNLILQHVEAILDSSIDKINRNFHGFIIQGTEYLKDIDDNSLIGITSDIFYEDIKNDIQKMNDKLCCMRLSDAIQLILPVIGQCNLCYADTYFWDYTGEDNDTDKIIIGNGKRRGRCPFCGSIDRHRWQYYVIQQYTNMLKDNHKVLHFAPEKNIREVLNESGKIKYITGDIRPGVADYVVDITDIQFENNAFDFIIANHVLEHILDEKKAIEELIRCLKPDGTIMLSFPICMDIDTLENSEYVSEDDRIRHYGQNDHVRLYGRDYKERFEGYGLIVEAYSPEKIIDNSTIKQLGLIRNEIVILCRKR